jgi:hypothetical protein
MDKEYTPQESAHMIHTYLQVYKACKELKELRKAAEKSGHFDFSPSPLERVLKEAYEQIPAPVRAELSERNISLF